ncbi:SRPBCC family protein, partial [Nocardia sp. NPDC059228]|uniref:SRPBCC family protein n=1 Tax=Nocardia sp. NPDC059228 TaxID=3346777 RepID=UPI003692E5A8
LSWTGKVFWSRRTWESTILEQVPFERIVWRSKGAKGYIDGAVSFHEITPDLTRILVVLEYHPGGVFEKTANLWRAARPPLPAGTQALPAARHDRGCAAQ